MRDRLLIYVLLACFGLAIPARGQPALLDAVRKDDLAAVEKLLATGLSPNPPPSLTRSARPRALTVLMIAAQRGNAAMVKILLGHRADPNIHTPSNDSALRYAAGAGASDAVVLLLRAGAQPNFPPGDPPLKRAIEAGHEDIVNMLLASGAPAKGPWAKSSPLNSAVGTGQVNIVLALLNHGSDPNQADIDETPLTIAARHGYVDLTQTLLTYGADVNFRTQDGGQTALSIAESTRHFDVAALLISAGAHQGNFPSAPQSVASIRKEIPAGVLRLYGRLHTGPEAASLTARALDDAEFINRRWTPFKPLDPTYRMNLTVYVYSLEAAYRERDEKKAFAMFEDLAADLHVKANHCRATGTGLGGLVNISVKTQRGNAEVGAWQVFWKPKILEFAKDFRAEAFPKPSSPTAQDLAPGRYLMWAQDPKTGRRGNEEVVTLGEGKKTVEKTLFVPD